MQSIMQLSPALLITVDNVEDVSSFISPTFSKNGRLMQFGTGSYWEKLLEVPLMGEGDHNADTTIRITVGIEPTKPAHGGRDPVVGLHDGAYINSFKLHDQGNYVDYTPCNAHNAAFQGATRVPRNTPAPRQYTMIFKPSDRYAVCSTAQEGGYINTAIFYAQLRATEPLSFVVHRQASHDQYSFNYILVEIL